MFERRVVGLDKDPRGPDSGLGGIGGLVVREPGRSHCRPGTGAASGKWNLGTGATVESIYRARTSKRSTPVDTGPAMQQSPSEKRGSDLIP